MKEQCCGMRSCGSSLCRVSQAAALLATWSCPGTTVGPGAGPTGRPHGAGPSTGKARAPACGGASQLDAL